LTSHIVLLLLSFLVYAIAAVRLYSVRVVPSLMNEITKRLADVVPVASVPVVLKPVPNVIVRLVTPDVRIIKLQRMPAAGTVVVYVAVAVGVTLAFMFVANAIAVAPSASTANGFSR